MFHDSATPSSHRDIVREALGRLLAEDDPEAFVVFDAPEVDRFVQFSGGVDEPLVLDLPRPALTDDEWERCRALLTERGARVEELGFETLTLDCGRDVEGATEAALEVLHEGLGIATDAHLSVDTGE